MIQDASAAEQEKKNFAKSVISNNLIWGLASSKGFIKANSVEYEDTQVIPFWSNEDDAALAINKGWENYKPASMPVSEFLENWLVGMYNEGMLVGINWSNNSPKVELEPLELALEIANQLIEQGKELKLTKYNDVEHYQEQVKNILEQD